MRAALSIVSLLVVLALVGLLAKKQLATLRPAAPVPAPAASVPHPAPAQGTRPEVLQQYQQSLEQALQTPRPRPADEP